MTYQVVLSNRAERDRDSAYRWYSENYSVEFANRWYFDLAAAIRSLGDQPLTCGIAHENDRFSFELRELLYGRRQYKHRVLFTIENNLIVVLHIRHSSQRDLTEDDL
jgi:plasmid stabilization system protein ParE